MNRLGLETLSAFGLPPVEYISLAADLGCANVSTGLHSIDINPHGYPPWNLRENTALRREMKAAMRDRGVSISLAEGLTVRPNVQARDRAAEFDLFAELGAQRVNVVSLDPDLGRTIEQFALTAEMAAERGMQTTTEFAPGLTVADLPSALEVIRQIDRPDFRLLIDTMHLIRSGSSPTDLAGIDPDLIGYVQLSDAPRVSQFSSYMQEAMTERRIPGEGELPLLQIIEAVPRDRIISLELPMLSRAKAGVGPHERLRPAVQIVRDWLARLG
jgi:sugar phosphate isomerase/epimerase